MKKYISVVIALIMALTVFWIPGQSVFAVEGDGDNGDAVFAQEGEDPQEDPPATQQYTVKFITNGGSSIADQLVTTPNEDGKYYATKPSDPTKAKDSQYTYTFAGWFTDEGLTNSFDFATELTGDIELYAKWDRTPIPVPDKVGTITAKVAATEKTTATISWSLTANSGKLTGVELIFNGKSYGKITGTSGSKKFTGLSDGTYYNYTVKPYYNTQNGTAVSGKALTKAPKQNGAYKNGNWEYYYKNGVKQRNTTISFKDTYFGTNKYKLNHYYDASGKFVGRKAAMYNKIKNMSSKKYLIAIDRTNNVMCVYIGGKGKWRPYKYWSCVTGRTIKKDPHPTPRGTYKVKSKKPKFSGLADLGKKKKTPYTVYYATRFVGGVFIHSQLYNKGTRTYCKPGGNAMGVNASHGCVRLFIDYSYWVYKNCPKGTTVVVID